MIECKKVSFSYPPNETDIGDRKGHGTLRNIDLSINDGDFVLLCGTSGCGKTTLTRLFNGLIPHYYDGKLEDRSSEGWLCRYDRGRTRWRYDNAE